MPRTAKRTQPPTAPQDQGYGVRGEQIAAQGAMPLPDNHSGGVPSETPMPAVPGGAPVEGGTPAQGPADPAAVLQMLSQQAPPPGGGLARPTERPNEELLEGQGGAMAASAPNKAAETLELMASATGDERFRAMAQRARMI